MKRKKRKKHEARAKARAAAVGEKWIKAVGGDADYIRKMNHDLFVPDGEWEARGGKGGGVSSSDRRRH